MRLKSQESASKFSSSLPYDPATLTWDREHRTNQERTYCYCGQDGQWYRQMLQCRKCLQWFHERCLTPRPMGMPLVSGDAFYIFVCSVCNDGRAECVKRVGHELTWSVLAHLLLFDLTVKRRRKGHDFQRHILPVLKDNWRVLQTDHSKSRLSVDDRAKEVEEALIRETGVLFNKREEGYELCRLLPPEGPQCVLSSEGIISERTVLTEATLSRPTGYFVSGDPIVIDYGPEKDFSECNKRNPSLKNGSHGNAVAAGKGKKKCLLTKVKQHLPKSQGKTTASKESATKAKAAGVGNNKGGKKRRRESSPIERKGKRPREDEQEVVVGKTNGGNITTFPFPRVAMKFCAPHQYWMRLAGTLVVKDNSKKGQDKKKAKPAPTKASKRQQVAKAKKRLPAQQLVPEGRRVLETLIPIDDKAENPFADCEEESVIGPGKKKKRGRRGSKKKKPPSRAFVDLSKLLLSEDTSSSTSCSSLSCCEDEGLQTRAAENGRGTSSSSSSSFLTSEDKRILGRKVSSSCSLGEVQLLVASAAEEDDDALGQEAFLANGKK